MPAPSNPALLAPHPGPRPATIRNAVRRTVRILSLLLGAALLALALGVLIPRPLWSPQDDAGQGDRILLLSGPIHTDIALPLDARSRDRFAFLAPALPLDHPGAEWLILGWGGRAFYLETPTWADLRPGPVLRALTLDSSVLHVDLAGPIPADHPAVRPLDLSPEARDRLESAILASFAQADGLPIPGHSYNGRDRFYEARGRFNLLLGCNTWTASMLRAAGLRTGWWTPLPRTLLASLRLHGP